MPKLSAGLLLFRRAPRGLEVLLVHMGGPFWARKDAGAWTIPKGEVEPGEDPEAAAVREFAEETGHHVTGALLPLGQVTQKAGKVVHAWAVEGDVDPGTLTSARVTLEWPRGSGRIIEFPEVDRAAWFSVEEARARLLPGQGPLLDRLVTLAGRRD